MYKKADLNGYKCRLYCTYLYCIVHILYYTYIMSKNNIKIYLSN